ncbi:MAG: cyclic pyranopterin monophosphate synthase MoaC [Acidobacteria bacterium]|nr:cyclic pyranopterin monophosphate synthase MoaC [Acidobacteriota bacterium]
MADKLSHLDSRGMARMVDVSDKAVTRREAEAAARVTVSPEAFQAACEGRLPKGDLLSVARLAGIAAAKRTADWIPLCHPLPLDQVRVEIVADHGASAFDIRATCVAVARTGVEMEALVAASAAALALYDMIKAMDRAAVIGPVGVVRKSGGRRGEYLRPWPPAEDPASGPVVE